LVLHRVFAGAVEGLDPQVLLDPLNHRQLAGVSRPGAPESAVPKQELNHIPVCGDGFDPQRPRGNVAPEAAASPNACPASGWRAPRSGRRAPAAKDRASAIAIEEGAGMMDGGGMLQRVRPCVSTRALRAPPTHATKCQLLRCSGLTPERLTPSLEHPAAESIIALSRGADLQVCAGPPGPALRATE